MAKSDDELKGLLGDEYEAYQAFVAARSKKTKLAEAKQMASAMVSEGGKYYDQYNRLSEQLDSIWEKVITEARAQVGITD